MPRRIASALIAGGAVAVIVGGSAAATTGYHLASSRGGLDHMANIWRGAGQTNATTASSKFTQFPFVPNKPHSGSFPTYINACAVGPVAVTLSVNVQDAPVDFRVLEDGKAMPPGDAHFATSPGDESRSFTFVGIPRAPGRHSFQVQWRSLTQQPVTVTSAALLLVYNRPSGGC